MTDFSRHDLDALKARVDLAGVMRSHGVELTAVGRNLKALCPWHEDKDASLVVNPEKGLYNCFGCSAKGDVLSFLQDRENLSFPQAAAPLAPVKGDPDRFPGNLTRGWPSCGSLPVIARRDQGRQAEPEQSSGA